MEELEREVMSHRFTINKARFNLGGEIRKYARSQFLAKGHLSNTVSSGRILELCREMLGPINSVCLNENVCCAPHRDKNNAGETWVCYFCDFQGGQLCLEDGRVYEGTRQWHWPFDGRRILHWNLEHTGDKYAVVAFSRRGQKPVLC